MSVYTLGRFIHIASAIVLVGSFLVTPLLHGAIRGSIDVRTLRTVTRLKRQVVTASGPAALLVLASGAYMTLAGWSLARSWIAVSIVLFVANGTLAMSIVDPHLKRLLEATEDQPDGARDAAVTAIVHDGRVLRTLRMIVGIDVAIVFLMVNKPAWLGSVAVAAAGLALGTSLATLASRRTRSPVQTRAVTE